MKVRALAMAVFCALLSAAHGARAQSTPTVAATSTALPLQLELGDSKLDAEAVRKAVELELKRPVILAPVTAGAPSLTVTAGSGHTVTVSYRTGSGEVRTRSIGVPEDSARGAEVIALLSGNLSRDEAAELLADLAAKATPATESTAASSAEPASEAKAPEAQPEGPKEPAATASPSPSPPASSRPPSNPLPPLIETAFPAINLSLWAPVSLYRDSEQRAFSGEFGLAYSHVGELRGVGLNLCALRTERDVYGVSLATFYDETRGTVFGITSSAIVSRRHGLQGVEVSGILNLGSGGARGASAAGLINLGRDIEGVQAAGLLNRADALQGVQAAGLLNHAKGVEGLQVAGLLNSANDLQGVQAAGLYNRAAKFSGVQASAGVNVAESISGLQLGVVNVAGDVDGAQVGIVNVAKHVDGASVGLVSVADNGRAQLVVWTSTVQPFNAAAKFTVGLLYTQAGLGYAPGDQTYIYELGLGGHFPIGPVFVEPGVHYSEMHSTTDPVGQAVLEHVHYRVAVGVDLGKVSPFGGAAVLQRFDYSDRAPKSVPVAAEVFGGVAFF
ncbi:MAG TPA: hypothetical protein VFK05_12330 [Polyangiaceae bacterium]|nr:hypothetical protein [Polyangiaceae bacterium]